MGLSCAERYQESRGRESSQPQGVIMEVVFELCLEREASVKGEKGAGVPLPKEWGLGIPFRDVVCVGHGG